MGSGFGALCVDEYGGFGIEGGGSRASGPRRGFGSQRFAGFGVLVFRIWGLGSEKGFGILTVPGLLVFCRFLFQDLQLCVRSSVALGRHL